MAPPAETILRDFPWQRLWPAPLAPEGWHPFLPPPATLIDDVGPVSAAGWFAPADGWAGFRADFWGDAGLAAADIAGIGLLFDGGSPGIPLFAGGFRDPGGDDVDTDGFPALSWSAIAGPAPTALRETVADGSGALPYGQPILPGLAPDSAAYLPAADPAAAWAGTPPSGITESLAGAQIIAESAAETAVPTAAPVPVAAASGAVAMIGSTPYASVQAAFNAANDGDTVTILPGVWAEGAVLGANNVTVLAYGAHLQGVAVQGKAALVITGDGNLIEGLEVSNISVNDGNGAAIRMEGTDLTLRDVHFHDNQEGYLGGSNGTILVEDSLFEQNGFDDPGGYAHGIYVGGGTLIIRRSEFLTSVREGHEVKSRAAVTIIEDSVIASLDSVDSRLIDLSNGGQLIIRNSVLEKGPNSSNSELIGFGWEGLWYATNSIQIENSLLIYDGANPNSVTWLGGPGNLPDTWTGNTFVGGVQGNVPGADSVWYATRSDAGLAPYPSLDAGPDADLSIAAASEDNPEGDAGTTAFTFTVTRSGDTSSAVTVDYAVSAGTADADDFGGTLPSGQVSFAAGETSKTITIDVAGDGTAESDETFTVTLSNASAGASIIQAAATGTIRNDDALPSVINGTSGNDLLGGTSNDDTMYGFAGNDLLMGSAGADKLDGGSGLDAVSYAGAPAPVDARLISGAGFAGVALGDSYSGVEILAGSDFDDLLVGDNAANILTGRGGDDNLNGQGGNDTLNGGAGNDYLVGGAGADVLIGGAGVDTASYVNAGAGVDARLVAGRGFAGDADGDTYTGIENLVGGNFDDLLLGNNGANMLAGGAGDDNLNGQAGDDTLSGGAGNDYLVGGSGADMLDGGGGTDTASYVNAAAGVDARLINGHGFAGDAAGDAFSGIENLTGGSFGDLLVGDSGANVLTGLSGDDNLNGQAGDDMLSGGAGDDFLVGGAGADSLNGGAGIDTASYVNAGSGVNARLIAGGGFAGDAAGDTFSGIENLAGGNFADVLQGNNAANVLTGGGGNDNLNGLGGDDVLNGGAGNDFLYGGAGGDNLTGGTGNDLFLFRPGDGADTIADFSGGAGSGDRIFFDYGGAAPVNLGDILAAAAQIGADTVIDFGVGNTVTLLGVALGSLAADDFLF